MQKSFANDWEPIFFERHVEKTDLSCQIPENFKCESQTNGALRRFDTVSHNSKIVCSHGGGLADKSEKILFCHGKKWYVKETEETKEKTLESKSQRKVKCSNENGSCTLDKSKKRIKARQTAIDAGE